MNKKFATNDNNDIFLKEGKKHLDESNAKFKEMFS
jgi:hypothetical protein